MVIFLKTEIFKRRVVISDTTVISDRRTIIADTRAWISVRTLAPVT